LRSGYAVQGVWNVLDDPGVVELAAHSADYVCVDLQHGQGSEARIMPARTVTERHGATLVVRVAWNEPHLIMRALDLGAQMVIVPMVSNAADARRAAASTSYPGAGTRSWGPIWADPTGTVPTLEETDAAAGCVVMIETLEGVQHLEEILGVPGVDGVYIGPNDLALSCGFGRATYRDSDAVDALIQNVVETVTASGRFVGLHCSDARMAIEWADRGVTMMTIGTDTAIMADGVAALCSIVRHRERQDS